jgi:hypothetical protein
MQLELITPQKAQEILDKNKASGFEQRKVNKLNVEKLSKVMEAGHFHGELAEPIAITADDELVNGQHRLKAVIESGCSQQMIVVRNADAEAFKYLDNVGKPRTNADILKLAGKQYSAEKAAAMRIIDLYEMQSAQIGASSKILGAEVLERVDKYGDKYLNTFAQSAQVLYGVGLRVSTSLAGLAIGFEDDKDNTLLLTEWVDGITKGKGLYKSGGDPRLALMKYGMANKGRASNQNSFIEDFKAYVYCWNKWIAGAEVKRLSPKSYSRTSKFVKMSPVTAYTER